MMSMEKNMKQLRRAMILATVGAMPALNACDSNTTPVTSDVETSDASDVAKATPALQYERMPEGQYTGEALLRRFDEVEANCPATLEVEKTGQARLVVSGGAQCGVFAFEILETEIVLDDDSLVPVRVRFDRGSESFLRCELVDNCRASIEVTLREGVEPRAEFRFRQTVSSFDAEVDFRVSAGGPPAPTDGSP